MKRDALDEIDFGTAHAPECAVQKMNATSLASPRAGVTYTPPLAQTGEAGGAASSRVEYEVMPDIPVLHNHTAPYHINKKERPAHRLMLELAAKGYTNKEIAETVGKTQVNVNNALRQPHSQQTLVHAIRERVSEDDKVVEVIRRNVLKSVELYEEVLNDEEAPLKERLEAAERFLNRRYGKPNQPINGGGTVDLNQLSDEELVRMQKQNTETTTS